MSVVCSSKDAICVHAWLLTIIISYFMIAGKIIIGLKCNGNPLMRNKKSDFPLCGSYEFLLLLLFDLNYLEKLIKCSICQIMLQDVLSKTMILNDSKK